MSDDEYFTYIGTRQGRGQGNLFGLRKTDRRRHVYAIGKTGTGKTTLLRNMIVQDIIAGHGVGVIDPHGDLAESLLDYIPPSRIDDVVYFNPTDYDYPIGLNLIRNVPSNQRHVLASGIVGAFKSIWRDSWGPRLEYILYAAVAALLDCENVSILGVQKMLIDEKYRHWVVKQVKDPAIQSFWLHEFGRYDLKYLREVIAPIQNKVGQLFMAAPIRNILGQVKSKIDPAFMMNDRRIFIANLSKGQLGADKANLLGALLVTQFQLAAMARATTPEEEREDFFLYIDEFHNFSTDSFASILSEARKYRLGLVLANQYIHQLHDDVRHAVFGNAGTLISFRVGGSDAIQLSLEFDEAFAPSRFTDLANHEICIKPLIQGESQAPFTGNTLLPELKSFGRGATVIKRSREKYSRPRIIVEDKIRRWMMDN